MNYIKKKQVMSNLKGLANANMQAIKFIEYLTSIDRLTDQEVKQLENIKKLMNDNAMFLNSLQEGIKNS